MSLPSASSPDLILAHPTASEIYETHILSSVQWAGALTKEQYIENEHQLSTHLVTRPNGITHWILTPKAGFQDERLILASCETVPKRCLIKIAGEEVRVGVVVGVAGVFCDPKLRGRGYAGRMMRELGGMLGRDGECMGSVLWSDIGPKFYGDLGWKPFPSRHVEFSASCYGPGSPSVATRPILANDIAALCVEDEVLLRTYIAATSSSKTLLAIVPDHHMMLWHHKKEEYICQKLFGKQPDVKGAIAGESSNRVWAIWTHGFYGAVDDPEAANKLYILRLVVENPALGDSELQVERLKAVLQAARREAAEWRLGHVELWNPDKRVLDLIERAGISHRIVDRENEGIPSLVWFGGGSGNQEEIEWFASEKYAWC
jgi:hypothetical protein